MKQILSVLVLVLVIASIAPAQEKLLPSWVTRDKTFVSTAWDSVFVTTTDYQSVRIIVSNDSGGTFIVARQNDTTASAWVKVKASEIVAFPPVNNTHWLRVKGDTASVHARIWVF